MELTKDCCGNCANAGTQQCLYTDMVPSLICSKFRRFGPNEKKEREEAVKNHKSSIERCFKELLEQQIK